MKKTLIASAVAAAFALPAIAQADVTIYGKVHNSIMSVDADTAGASTTDQWQVHSHASRLGFKGTEDLGGGLKAVFKYEQAYDTDQAGAVTGARNTYVGLTGSFGTFVVGRHDTPAKMAWYAQGTDLLGDSIADMNADGVGGDDTGGHHFDEVRASNAIAYVSPNMSGFTFAGAIVPGETAANDGLADSYSLGLMYKAGGIKLGAGYESLAGGVGAPDDDMWHVGGSYTFDNVTLGATYMDINDDGNVAGTDREAFGLSGKVAFGANAVGANYRTTDQTTAAASGDLDSWSFWVEHNFSKRTKVYAAVADHENDLTNQDTREYGVGIIHDF
ncbi:MAG: porin [Gammaproteobacteria bacterium]